MIPLAIVAAIADNGVIGRDNRLPWRLATDLRRFRALTWGRPLLMGRRTWDSIGRPLPGRRTVVLTRDPDFRPAGAEVAQGFEDGLGLARRIAADEGAEAVMVVGGTALFAAALPIAARLHLTLVHAWPDGDACFPAYDAAEFRETWRESHPAGASDDHPFTFLDLERRPPR